MCIARRPVFVTLAMFCITSLIACAPQVVPSYVENIQCQYSFHGVDSIADRERVYAIARQYAKSGTLQPAELPTTPDFQLSFVIPRLSMIDAMHGPIIFAPSTDSRLPPQQIFNAHVPTFSISYDTAMINARIEVTVRLTITPGAQLFYKPEGEPERDLTGSVGPNGAVLINAVISKGQDYIYARTRAENVVRYVRINVHTQQVEQIQQSQYP